MRTLDHCPACGSNDAEIVARLDDERQRRFLAYSEIKYGGLLDNWLDDVPPFVLRCWQCGHCWYKHQPSAEQLGQMYAAGRRLLPEVKLSREPSAPMNDEMARLRKLMRQSAKRPSLLDYGSGYGRWARAAMMEGFEVTAYEPAVTRGAEAEDPGFELVHDLAELQGRRFNLINLEQVLEHVPDPLTVLLQVKDFCLPAAVIRITVPNILRAPEGRGVWESWPFDGTSPHILAPFEHLHGFTPRSLFKLLERAGFKRLALDPLIYTYPLLTLRYVIGQLWPTIGHTFALAQLRS